MRSKKWRLTIVLGIVAVLLCGCVDQHPDKTVTGTKQEDKASDTLTDSLAITDESEKSAVEAARKQVDSLGHSPRIIATSPATAEICDRLKLDLVGVCSSEVSQIPDRYKKVPTIGAAMSPDMEKVTALRPDWILSPSSLQSDLQPKYEAVDTQWAFLNLKSVQGMYRSIQELGMIFDRTQQAEALVQEFTDFYTKYQKEQQGKSKPKVLILMGMPGSYVIATPNSYVGNLVELAGGENVYADVKDEFVNVNTEDMQQKNPDIILRAAHALPDQVVKMFDKEFKNNSIWKHFEAVQNDRVYDLSYDDFGMSASFRYQEALQQLQKLLYG